MKKSVVLYKKLSAPLMARLHEQTDVTLIEALDDTGLAKLRDALPGAHGLLGASLRLDAKLLDLAPQLEAVASVSVGVDNYDIDYLTARGILLSNTPDVLTETTADTGFALILATARRVVELADMVRAGQWNKNIGPAHFGSDVHGKADFVCLTLPLTAETEKLIGAEQFARMGPETIFINISRGKVVDEAALVEALQQRTIRAAGLDVFEKEPLDHSSPLLRLNNVVATPHIGSATHETREAMAKCAVDNLLQALAGEKPKNLVNANAWDR